MNKLKEKIKKIKTLWQWVKLLWLDRQYDYVFLIKILQFKLKLIESYYEKRNRHKYHQIWVMRKLCDRLIADEYYEMVFDPLEKQYGKSTIEFEEPKEANGVKTIGIKVSDPLSKTIRKYGYERVKRLQKQDLKMLTDMLYKNILNLWD